MPAGKLVRFVVQNARRNRKQFALSAFGVVVGISAFILFLALSAGVTNWVLGDMFPLEKIEVIPPRATVSGGNVLNDEIVAKIRARKEVAEAVPRMALSFPARGRAYFQGQAINFEAGGFCDGVDPSFLADEKFADMFRDWDSEEELAKLKPCGPPPTLACDQPERYYCVREDNKCHHRLPVVLSTHVLEIYNKQFAPSHRLPGIGKDMAQWIVERGGYQKMKAYLYLGDTTVAGSNKNITEPVRKVEAMLLGLSDKAMELGFTVPIQYVKRWNKAYAGEEATKAFSSIVVTVRSADDVAVFGNWLRDELDLRLEDHKGEQLANIISTVTVLLFAISIIIVIISAINIAHNFFMQVSERRREIGLLRALGATRGDVAGIILGEAALIGLSSGLLAWCLARVLAIVAEYIFRTQVGDFAFKPDELFDFQTWIVVAGIGFSIFFCVLGGMLPARRAARLEPAQALVQN